MPSTTAQGLTQANGFASAVATTANGAVVLAPHQAYGIFVTDDAVPNNEAADQVRDTLLAAGWFLAGTLQALGSLSGPFGWGYLSPFAQVVEIIYPPFAFDARFIFYDPTVTTPVVAPDVIWVEVGASSALSLANLLIAINFACGAFLVASSPNPDLIVLNAIIAGTLGNSIEVIGNGSNSVGVSPSGGGWILQSRSPKQVFGSGNTASVIVSAYPSTSNRLEVDINIGGTVLPAVLGSNVISGGYTLAFPTELGGWQLIADDFGACFICTTPFHGGDIFVFNNFLWATALYIPPSIPLTYAAFVMRPGLGGAVSSLGAAGNMAVDSFAGSSHISGSTGQQGWSIGMFHSEGGMVADPTGAAMLQPPWVFLPTGSGESRICGQLFDGLASSGPNLYTQQFTIANYNYRVVATQTNPPGSLLLSTGEVSNAGTASGSNPAQPNPTHPAPPSSAAGLGDVSDASPYLGQMVVISSTSAPDSTWIGESIIIGGSTYTVAGVSSPTITFTPVAPSGTALNVPFSISL